MQSGFGSANNLPSFATERENANERKEDSDSQSKSSAEDKVAKLERMRQLQSMGFSREMSAQAVHVLGGSSMEEVVDWAEAEQRRVGGESINLRVRHVDSLVFMLLCVLVREFLRL